MTTFAARVTASDADGDPLSYEWDVIGSRFQGPAVDFGINGSTVSFAIRISVSDGKTTTTDSRQIRVKGMTGRWLGIDGPSALGKYEFTLTQDGTKVSGTYHDSTFGDGRTDPAEPGTIDANGNLTIRIKQGRFTDWTFKGKFDATGERVSGGVFGSGFNGQPFTIELQ